MSAEMIPGGFPDNDLDDTPQPDPIATPELSVADAKRRASAKRRLRASFVAPLLIAGLLMLLAMSAIFSAVARSQETEDIFTDAAELPPGLIEEVTWLPDPAELPRQMEPLTRTDLTASFLRAWEQMAIVSETGDTSGVATYFAGSARQGVVARAGEWHDLSIKQLGHTLELSFYSEDGQVVAMTATESRILRERHTDAGVLVQESLESYEVVLVLDAGQWRIHHLIRRTYEPGAWTLMTN